MLREQLEIVSPELNRTDSVESVEDFYTPGALAAMGNDRPDQSRVPCRFGDRCRFGFGRCRYFHPEPVRAQQAPASAPEPVRAQQSSASVPAPAPVPAPVPAQAPAQVPCRIGAECWKWRCNLRFLHPACPRGADCTWHRCNCSHPPRV
jgi:hypothetical protein